MSMNTASLLERARYRYADRTALVFGDRRWTYAEMDRDVNALAAGLRAHGIGRGDRVAVLAMNLPEYLFLGVALAKLAAVMVPLNYRVHERELLYMVEHCRAIAVAGESAFADTAEALATVPGQARSQDLPGRYVQRYVSPQRPAAAPVRGESRNGECGSDRARPG